MEQTLAVILAAGEGTRMKSSLPKVLHPLCGRPMLWHVLRSAKEVSNRQILVVGHGGERVKEYFGEGFTYVEQERQLGTGHALQQVLPYLPGKEDETGKDKESEAGKEGLVLVLCGDTPLLEGSLLRRLVEHHCRYGAAATVLTAKMDEPRGYGRMIRDESGAVQAIVEELHATGPQKEIKEINTGTYCFDIEALRKYLPNLPRNEEKGEYYLTDLLPILAGAGCRVEAFMLEEAWPAAGINDRAQLSMAAARMRERINCRLMEGGVTLIDPACTYVDVDVQVGEDTVIYPQTILEGNTRVGRNCRLGPDLHMVNVTVGSAVVCCKAMVVDSSLHDGAQVGPYAYIRPGSTIGAGARVGDFVEVKNSSIGEGTKVPHLSYVGDARLGAGVNIGAGVIVVNFDGRRKHLTSIEEGAFIGCNSNLVAPLTVGKGAFIAAGSTVTRNVPAGALAISRVRQRNKKGLAGTFLKARDK